MRANPRTEQWLACPSIQQVFVACFLLLVGGVLPIGCNRSPSEAELGEIHYSLPHVPGAENSLKLPPPLTRKPKPKAETEATTKESESAASAADSPEEKLDQQPTPSENTPAEERPAAESD